MKYRTVIKLLPLLFLLLLISPPEVYNEYYAKHSYISSINIDEDMKIEFMNNPTIKHLNRDSGWRPIFINETDNMSDREYGYAIPTPIFCVIFINANINDKKIYELVLLHEILHCYGYLHSPNMNDIMYKYIHNERQRDYLLWYLFEIDENSK